MKRITKPLRVLVFTGCAIGWGVFSVHAIQSHKETEKVEYTPKYDIENMKSASILNRINDSYQLIYDERDRLVKEEQIRLQELERKRLLKLEQERLAELAKIEAEKKRKLDEQKKLEEAKKKELTSKKGIAYNDNKGEWMTFDASYYGADCYKCSGKTKVGIDVRNTIYYDGLRIIALDPRVIPLWTIVEVQTPNETFKALVADTGGKIKGRKADILVESEAVSAKYGRHDIQIRVIGKYNK